MAETYTALVTALFIIEFGLVPVALACCINSFGALIPETKQRLSELQKKLDQDGVLQQQDKQDYNMLISNKRILNIGIYAGAASVVNALLIVIAVETF